MICLDVSLHWTDRRDYGGIGVEARARACAPRVDRLDTLYVMRTHGPVVITLDKHELRLARQERLHSTDTISRLAAASRMRVTSNEYSVELRDELALILIYLGALYSEEGRWDDAADMLNEAQVHLRKAQKLFSFPIPRLNILLAAVFYNTSVLQGEDGAIEDGERFYSLAKGELDQVRGDQDRKGQLYQDMASVVSTLGSLYGQL